jgi:hypothetical protein
MAPKSYGTQLQRYDDPNAAYLPDAYKDLAANAYQNAASQYGNSFSANHPVASKALGALGGLILGGPLTALAGPLLVNKAENQRKANVVAGYQNYINTLNNQQKDLLSTQESGVRTAIAKNTLNNMGVESPIPYDGLVDNETLKTVLNGGTANNTLDASTARIQNAQANAFNAYGGFGSNQGQTGSQSLNQSLPPLQIPVGEDNPLTGGVNNAPLMPYTYMDPTAVNATIGQIGSITGQAPNDYATLQKLSPEIAKLVAERNNQQAQVSANNALAGQRVAQTKTEAFKPQLLKAQANAANSTASFNARRYAGGPAPQQPTVAALMLRNYNAGAYGPPGSPQALQSFQAALANDPSGYETVTQNTYDPSGKKVISSSSRRVPIQRGASPSQSAPAGAGVTVKGNHGTYSF